MRPHGHKVHQYRGNSDSGLHALPLCLTWQPLYFVSAIVDTVTDSSGQRIPCLSISSSTCCVFLCFCATYMSKAASTSHMFGSVGDLPREEQFPSKAARERRIDPQVSTVCRYYAAGTCRRGSSCRYSHPPLVSVQQAEYPYTEGLDFRTRTQCKGWNQDVLHSFTAFPTTTEHAFQGFDASRDVLDNFSDFSSSNDSVVASDQSLGTAFKVMTVKEAVSSEFFPSYHSGFSQSSQSSPYPNNLVTRYGNVAYPGYYREDIPTGSNFRSPTRRKADEKKKKFIAYKTKPCKFFSASKTCALGDKCTFIHDVEKVRRAKMVNSQDRETKPYHLPPKPRSLLEDFKARDFYPVTWRVIGGGVMMGPPCRAFAARYCPHDTNCRLTHETELETSTNNVVELKSQPSSRQGSPCAQPRLDSNSNTESKRRIVSMEHSILSPTNQGTYEDISNGTNIPPSGCEAREEPSSVRKQSNTHHAASVQRRRTRSMSLPSSPSIFGAPRIFAEL
ncbi:hypothetical protein K503DRAFT_450712 [Rhizopogon vinicolor AM-OR11-026]|uniref:C3H1-type domain-containing protein n=1 Tax=Rhizopogon vinicolor AM-OR11-026 TaxID=1314800 RepID=A0A1B7NHI3_9AGAM|nr:hypothetical protein K503DRAFT_450712 [Rhizopogon vinicolor AM-OR11-026]